MLRTMDEHDYEYRGLKAATWDHFRGNTSHWGDRAAFRAIIDRHGQPALDVGCATGRLLLDYLAEGIDIDGVDLSPEMLGRCRARAAARGLTPTLYQQAMEHLDLPRKYGTILVPSSSFQLLTDAEQARAAMRRFHDHLLPGGALAMPFMTLWREGEPREKTWPAPRERVRPEDGAVVRHWERVWYDPAAQLEHTEDRYEVVRDGAVLAAETIRRSPATRWYTHDAVRALYREAGFVDVRLTREWSGEPAAPDDPIVTAVGTRP
ncbi:MAG TPA: class I SAM-dependent methyltransferase [Thermomicrobiales bacterium]